MVKEGDYVRNVKAHISYVLDGKDIDISNSVIKAKVDEIACSGNVLKMGEFCKNSVEFEYKPSLLENPNIFWNNKKIKVSLKYEYLFPKEDTFPSPKTFLINALMLGVFYVSGKDVETSNNGYTYTVTAYDVPSKMSESYDAENSPNNSIEILSKIENDTGMKFSNKELISSFTIDSIPDGTTYAGMVGYIAGYEGYNARVNSAGYIELYWYYNTSIDQTSLFTITRKDQYLGGFKNKEELPSINALSSGKDVTDSNENSVVFTAGSGESLTYANPYITQDKVNEIYNRIKGFEYCIGEIKWRGEQDVRAGDLVRIETKTGEYVLFPVMEYSMTFDGGMVAESSSYSYIVDNNVMGTAPNDKKLVKLYNNLTKTFKKQTGIVKMNAKGGFYRLLIDDETGFPYGWIVSDSEEITETTKGWMWTKGGLMHSSDGFRTADKVAFTEDGQLSAEMISAHSISLGNLNVDALNKIEGAYDYADTGDRNTLSSAKSYADTSAQNAVNAQTQDDIFNKLTNNGTVKGIVLQNGKLYINADYITSGILNATLLRAGIIKSAKNDGNYWNLDTGEFRLQAIDNMLVGGTNLVDGTMKDVYVSAGGNTEEYMVLYTALEQDKPYVLSFEATSSNTDQITVRALNNNSRIYKDYTVDINKGRSYVFINSEDQATDLYLYCGLYGQTAWKTVCFHHIMLEKGTVASDWSPSPNDLMSTVAELSQEDIFNKLTNNGQTQGIYLQNGKLYINADYLQSGTIKGINIEGATITGGEINTPKQIQFINDGNVSKIFASKASINGGPEEPALLLYSSNFDFLGTSDDPLNSFAVSSKYFSLFMIDTGVYITHNKDRIARSDISLTDTWAYLLSEGNGIYAYANGKVEITSNGAIYINSKSDIYENAKDSSGNVKSRLLLYSNGYAYLDSIGNDIYIRSRTPENDANKAFLDLLSNGQVWLCGESQSTIKAKGNSYVESVGNNVYVRSRNSDDTSTNAQLVLQNDGKAFLIGNGNGNTFINGYPAVRVNGSYHDIFFQWNGASLIATVDVTQVWSTSDRRLKDQIEKISDDYIDAIGSAEIKQFIFTDEIYDKSIKHFGVIAQDVREALEEKGINPEEIAVNNHFDRDGEEYYGIDKEEFLMARIAYDEKKIKELEDKIARLEAIVSKLSL